MKVCIAEWIGKRISMEDAHLVRHYPHATLALVCDGMGGHDYGALAAHTACNSFAEFFEKESALADIPSRLKTALFHANDAVGEKLSSLGAYGGCTLLAVYVTEDVMWWVSVGDSPLVIWRAGRLLRLNEDHSMRDIYERILVKDFGGSRSMLSQANALRSAVTGEDMSLIDAPTTPYLLLPGDRILLASDGVDEILFTRPLRESVRRVFMQQGNQLAAELVEACRAMASPEADNVTVLTMDRACRN